METGPDIASLEQRHRAALRHRGEGEHQTWMRRQGKTTESIFAHLKEFRFFPPVWQAQGPFPAPLQPLKVV